jgi:hypothetical protein
MMVGLLQGFGRGLSQGATMLQQGMAEDRAVSREEERERMRQVSIERRWKVDDSRYADSKAAQERAEARQAEMDKKADTRYADDKAFRESQANKHDQQFNAQMAVRDKQLIESNLTGIMEQEARASEKIRQMYEKRMQSGTEDVATLEAKMEAELTSSQLYYSGRLEKAIQSYGLQLKGTSFSYLLDMKEPAATVTEPNETKPQVDKPAFDRSAFVDQSLNATAQAVPTPNLSKDSSGAPELTLSNLMKKWNTPSSDSPVRPGLLTPEILQKHKDFNQRLTAGNIQSAYGAAFFNNAGL